MIISPLVTMDVFSRFFSRVIFQMPPQMVRLIRFKVPIIAFPRFFPESFSNVYSYALFETMQNLNGFICTKLLHIKFANVKPMGQTKAIHF